MTAVDEKRDATYKGSTKRIEESISLGNFTLNV